MAGPPLNLRHLEYFVAVADAGTMTGGAQRLFVSQSAVSLAIRDLERALDSQLLIRHRAKGIELTPAGRRLLGDARDLLAHAEDVRAGAQESAQELRGQLTVGCFPSAAAFLLPGLLEAFGGAHPKVELDFVEGSAEELERAMLLGRCELSIFYDLEPDPRIETEPLRSAVPYALLSPEHRLAKRRRIRLADLAGEPMILLDISPSRRFFERVFQEAGVELHVRHGASSYELVRSLVARNLGYALLFSRPAVDSSYEGLPLCAVPLAGAQRDIDLVLGWPRGVRLTRRARAFADLCRRTLRDTEPRAG